MLLVYLEMIDSPEDKTKFEIMYIEYRGLMYSVAYGVLMNEMDAEDAVHQAFLKVIENMKKIGEPVSPMTKSFLVTIARNMAINMYNYQRRHEFEPLDEDKMGLQYTYDGSDLVKQCLAKLLPRQREFFNLKYNMGFNNKEISRMMGLRIDNVRQLEKRAKDRFREACMEVAGMISDEMIAAAIRDLETDLMATLPDPKDCNHVFSSEFERKMQKLVNKAKYFTVYTTLKRVACLFVAFLLAAGMFVSVNPTARAIVVQWVQERFGDYYHYFFVGEEKNVEEPTVVPNEVVDPTIEDDSVAAAVVESYVLGWVPEGYTLLSAVNSDGVNSAIYTGESGEMLFFNYFNGSDSNSIFTGVGEYEQKYVSTDGFFGEVFIAIGDEDTNGITWISDDDKTRFIISAHLGEEDLIKMAQSVVPEKIN